ncbi:hypothetical protein [Dethiobacter alkaliphilus]|uniref:Uncharacterized protein n=1 Tax=Dethiobacter alkaliphilus AHT 1 TaxID=555088 RepID=C0GE79_DETAL|nr:hypothetical protein [Dethiobacter alkaliphilus]EEG78373.1 hypothetical protein DealDRAFT_0788 [Dethiobacter alkaliphilus AHT 1]
MTRDEYIEIFQNEFGRYPDECEIPAHVDDQGFRSEWTPPPRQQRMRHHYHTPANELLDEIGDVVKGLAGNARVAYQNREEIAAKKPYISEFGFMVMIFAAKAGLYFLLKHSREVGFELSNI